MTREQAVQALKDVAAGIREAFPEAVDRLAQLDSHIATAVMVVEHIHDEAERHQEGD